MLCPTCGPKGKLEQVEFGPERELWHCHTCSVTYVVHSISPGEYTEPVPLQVKRAPTAPTPRDSE